jgi:hypothetical protein
MYVWLISAEPSIITDHTQFVEVHGHRLRIVHIIHELGSKVPLIVFIHGLGGQVGKRIGNGDWEI